MSAINTNKPAQSGIVSKINSCNIAHCILGLLFVGVVLILGGIIAEVHNEIELLKQSGDAFKNYQTMLHATAINSMQQYVLTGILGQLPSAGGNLQACGIAISCVLAPLAGIVMFALRSIMKPVVVKDPWNFALA